MSIAAGIVLITLAAGPVAKWAAVVFTLTSMLLFGISALYHRFNWQPKTKRALKRFDHANIFLLIAGTYTPIALLTLPREQGLILLVSVWVGALLGVGFRVFWIGAPRWLYVALYLALGWAAVMFIPDIFRVNAAAMVLVVVGGLLYTVGAVVYGMKKPNPIPGVFGFHTRSSTRSPCSPSSVTGRRRCSCRSEPAAPPANTSRMAGWLFPPSCVD